MIKIAIASVNGCVANHFGHCESFYIYEVENGKLLTKTNIENPGHKPGFLPNYLNDIGVNVIIAGGMGSGAIDIFNEKNIDVILGADGEVEKVALNYADGKLHSIGSACMEHNC